MAQSRAELTEKLALANRILGTLDITHEALGHVSCRLEGGETMLIKGKGPDEVGLRYSQEHDILEVDYAADKVSGAEDLQPPSESFIHIWMYKARPEVNAVVHMHPEEAVLLTVCDKPILPIYGAFGGGARLAVKGIPLYPHALTVTDDAMGQELAECMGDHDVCLMRGHGITAVGTSIEQATLNCIHLVELTRMNYKAYLLGNPRPIPAEDIAQMEARMGGEGRKRGSAGGEVGAQATWRYYARLAAEKAGSRF